MSTPPSPAISVIIPTYNGAESCLRRCFEAGPEIVTAKKSAARAGLAGDAGAARAQPAA